MSSFIVASSETALIVVFFKDVTKDFGPVALPSRREKGGVLEEVHLL